MRVPHLASFLIGALLSGNVSAQTLEESYAKLCSDAAKAKSEACQILAKSLVAKLQGQQSAEAQSPTNAKPDAATQALWRKRWGVFLDMIGTELFAVVGAGAGSTPQVRLAALGMRSKMEWKIPGEEIVSTVIAADGTRYPMGTTRWDEQGQRLVQTFPPPSELVAYWVAQPDGSVRLLEQTYGGLTSRSVVYMVSEGRFETVSEKLEGGVWVEMSRGQNLVYSPERLELERQALQRALQQAQQQAAQQLAQSQQDARNEKRAASQRSAAMFNSVLQGVSQGLAEVNTGGYAESQANLDATVANIQHAADLERQQQVLAQQQAQARAAEENRQKLAENARWVAEKEQAAAEHRSGQAEAAAAREAQLVAQKQADDQRRANAEAQRRSVEQAATIDRQRLQAAALAERSGLTARPVNTAQASTASGVGFSQASSPTGRASDPIEMFAFFINLDGKTVAFEGPTAMTVAEGNAKKARLAAEAPGRYGAGATVKDQSMGNGYCAFVYQLPGKGFYVLGSDNNLATAIEEKDLLVKNSKALIHHDVVCPTNN